MSRRVETGIPDPLGVTPLHGGVNVAVYSVHATSIELCLFDAQGVRETERIALPERTEGVFHGFIRDVAPGARYGLRAHGPFDPANGHRFNPAKLLIDPYARTLDRRIVFHPAMYGGNLAPDDVDSAEHVAKAIVAPQSPPLTSTRKPAPWSSMIVYELHVRGFTKLHPGIPKPIRGTCAGLAHPAAISHLARLGITTVKLMPVVAAVEERHLAAVSLTNYWRYNPVAWMAPDPWLAPGGIDELAACVAALHAAGIEVIQDIVLNHSGEGDELGPTLSLRGLDNATYYRLGPEGCDYVDDTGCGNTLALDRSPVLRLALDSLRHFATAAGVDGFRFDLGTTLGRRDDGFDPSAPFFAAVAQDPVLCGLKMIVEPWDLGAHGYRLGAFPADWGEWNDRCRDSIRRFWLGARGTVGELATRLAGSADVFSARARRPSRSINFVTTHDGFTLADLVSYETKHNEANGEDNRDGTAVNHSWNHGVEGLTDDPVVGSARRRDMRNLLATLLVARGTPMLSMGDELGRTQHGNNNAYAQDNALSWIDWANADHVLIDFVAALCSLRRSHPALHEDRWLTGEAVDHPGIADVEWRRADGHAMTSEDWRDPDIHLLVAAFHASASNASDGERIVLALNAGPAAIDVHLPHSRKGTAWRRLIDTTSPTGQLPAAEGLIGDATSVAARSVLIVVEERARVGVVRPSMDNPNAFAELAVAAGILPEWTDVHGIRHDVSLDTQRALLAAMGLGAQSAADARARLCELSAARRCGPLPRAIVSRNEDVEVAIMPSEVATRGKHRLRIRCENGEERELPFDLATLPIAPPGSHHGDKSGHTLKLPPLGQGVHEIWIEDDSPHCCSVIVAPARCHLPEELRRGERRFGLAAPLYALRRDGDQGIGDFTTLAAAARATAEVGGSIVGINPLHALFTSDRERASPYHPSDRRFVDPLYIDVQRITDFTASREARAVLAANGGVLATFATSRNVDYAGVWSIKRAVLDACFATFERRHASDPLVFEFDEFVRARGSSLEAFALFDAISTAHPRSSWQEWPRELHRFGSASTNTFAAQHARDVRLAMYMQWQSDRQFRMAADEARNAGIRFGLYRDLAIGAAPDGAEAWASSGLLANGVSIGAPPDAFSPAGQVWNLPPVTPHCLAASGYAAFRELVAANMRHAGALRIDHVMGLARLFWVPDGAPASDGAYVSYPLDDLLGVLALESDRARCLVVGEDLGTVPRGLRERLAAEDILSYRVLWFERDASGYNAPTRYPAKAAACVSTHDLPTIAGWWSGADIAEKAMLGMLTEHDADRELGARATDRALLADAINRERSAQELPIDATAPHDAAITAAIHRHLALCPATLMLVQADDLAEETAAQNLPATDRERPNWRRKVRVDAGKLWETRVGQLTAEACATRRAPYEGFEP